MFKLYSLIYEGTFRHKCSNYRELTECSQVKVNTAQLTEHDLYLT